MNEKLRDQIRELAFDAEAVFKLPINEKIRLRYVIVREWVKGLRSGEYTQGFAALKASTNKGYQYCGVGVLCEALRLPSRPIHNKEATFVGQDRGRYRTIWTFDKYTASIPDGLGAILYAEDEKTLATKALTLNSEPMGIPGSFETAVSLNDSRGGTFAALARCVEATFPDAFENAADRNA